MSDVNLADLTVEHFEPLLGKGFSVSYPEHQETLTLAQVERKERWRDTSRQGFSLIFKGSSTQIMLQQGTHALEEPDLGRLEIFLVPVGRERDDTHVYQAVFS